MAAYPLSPPHPHTHTHTHTHTTAWKGSSKAYRIKKFLWVILDWNPLFWQKAASCHGPFQISFQHRNGTKIWHVMCTDIYKPCEMHDFRLQLCSSRELHLLGYYTASSGNIYRHFRTTYRSNPQGSRIQKKACSPNTEFVQGRAWAKSLNIMVLVNGVVAYGSQCSCNIALWMKEF